MLQQLKAASQQVLAGSVLEPNPKYRTAVGVLGVALPPVLLLWAMDEGVQRSISGYYYTAGRDWFVGTLSLFPLLFSQSSEKAGLYRLCGWA